MPSHLIPRTAGHCARLTETLAVLLLQSSKGEAMRSMIRSSFKAQRDVTDPQEIARLKSLAIVGVQNYVVFEQTGYAPSTNKDHGRADVIR